MKDALFIIWKLIRDIVEMPISIVHDYLWFNRNYRPNWLRKSRNKLFDRLDKDRARIAQIKERVEFYIKRTKDSQS